MPGRRNGYKKTSAPRMSCRLFRKSTFPLGTEVSVFLTQFHPAVTGMNLCGSHNRKILALYRALPDSPTAISGIPARKCTSTPLPHPLSLSGLALASAARVLSFVIALNKFIIVCLKFLSIAKTFAVLRCLFTVYRFPHLCEALPFSFSN